MISHLINKSPIQLLTAISSLLPSMQHATGTNQTQHFVAAVAPAPQNATSPRSSRVRVRARASESKSAPVCPPATSSNPLCGHIHRFCLQDKLEGFDYCIRHILQDKNAPFKQCAFLHAHLQKRCPNAARKTDRRDATLCPFHMSKLSARRRQQQVQQLRLNLEEETASDEVKKHMRNLEHFCAAGKHEKKRINDNWIVYDDGTTNASDALRYKVGEAQATMQDSDSDEELANPTIDDLMKTNQLESDCESIESDHEDPLHRAGTMAPEEVSRVLRDKMLRLKNLYLKQFNILQQTYKDKRRKFLYSLMQEKETPGLDSISRSVVESGDFNLEEYNKLKALLRHQNSYGHEALVKKQVDDMRKATSHTGELMSSSKPACIFIKEGQRCGAHTIPLSHYCKQRKLNVR